jgi:hypothetical protein
MLGCSLGASNACPIFFFLQRADDAIEAISGYHGKASREVHGFLSYWTVQYPTSM